MLAQLSWQSSALVMRRSGVQVPSPAQEIPEDIGDFFLWLVRHPEVHLPSEGRSVVQSAWADLRQLKKPFYEKSQNGFFIIFFNIYGKFEKVDKFLLFKSDIPVHILSTEVSIFTTHNFIFGIKFCTQPENTYPKHLIYKNLWFF